MKYEMIALAIVGAALIIGLASTSISEHTRDLEFAKLGLQQCSNSEMGPPIIWQKECK